MSEKCKACGVKWIDHLGIQGTCEQLKAAEAVIAQARRFKDMSVDWDRLESLLKSVEAYDKLTQPKQGD